MFKKLNKDCINRANMNSHFNKGSNIEKEYNNLCNEIINNFDGVLREKFLNKAYNLYSDAIVRESDFVPINVAGTGLYNSKKAEEQINRIMQINEKICSLNKDIEKTTLKKNQKNDIDEKTKIKFYELMKDLKNLENGCFPFKFNLTIQKYMISVFELDKSYYIQAYEYLNSFKKQRKNSTLYKLHLQALENPKDKKVLEIKKFNSYEIVIDEQKQRVFIKFYVRPKRQLIVALKSRKFFWNNTEQAWSTYLDKYKNNFEEWSYTLEEKYRDYI